MTIGINGWILELQTKVREDFTITTEGPTRTFSIIIKSSRTFVWSSNLNDNWYQWISMHLTPTSLPAPGLLVAAAWVWPGRMARRLVTWPPHRTEAAWWHTCVASLNFVPASISVDIFVIYISKPLHLHKMHAPGGQSKDIPCVFWETQRMYFLQDEATSAETSGRLSQVHW